VDKAGQSKNKSIVMPDPGAMTVYNIHHLPAARNPEPVPGFHVSSLRNCENVKAAHCDVSGIPETWKCPAEFDIQRLILNRPLTSTRHDHEHEHDFFFCLLSYSRLMFQGQRRQT
jgi:hypothetical protein